MNIDFHAHILPKADHGSDSLETSLRQVALAREAGIDLLAATPHFYPGRDTVEAFLQRRAQTFQALTAKLDKSAPRLILGAEVQLCRGIDRMEEIEQLCFAGTRVLLLELPPDFRFKLFAQTLDALHYDRKLTIVFAHVDRYAPDVTNALLDAGFLGQLNASALCRMFQKKRCLQWAQTDSIVALGSDIHGTDTGYTEFLRAKARLGSLYDTIMQRTEALFAP